MKSDFPNITQVKSESKSRNFKEMHRTIMMFKAWLRSIHHSVINLQAYIDEYSYRLNRHFINERIIENLIVGMVNSKSYPSKMFIS